MSVEIHFVIAQENGKSKKFRLTNEEYVVIGRSKTLCQVYLDDPLCSSTHTKVSVVNNAIFVEDLNSKNGVFLNGVKIIKQRIYVDDKIRLGDCILFVNHSRMDEESIAAATYKGKNSREGNLTLELMSKSKASINTNNKALGKMFKPPSRKETEGIGRRSINSLMSKKQVKNAHLVDVFFTVLLFGVLNVAFLNMYPEAYKHMDRMDFFIAIFKGRAMKYTVASLIICIMFHNINRRLPSGSIGERIVGVN